MLTYRVRPRVFRLGNATLPALPAKAHVIFYLTPDQPFGCAPGGGRTAVKAVAAEGYFNPSTGEHTIESKEPLKPLTVNIDEPLQNIRVSGTRLEITRQIQTTQELQELVEAVYYVFPLLLTPDFADPPLVDRVEGTIGDVPFRWELSGWRGTFITTTQGQQENYVQLAWARLPLLAESQYRRLLASLHYLHVACRLQRIAACPGEFLSEALLNFAKILEVLFQDSRDVARRELIALGFSKEEVERDFMPAMLLRSQIDVAHASLVLFKPEELQILHHYTDRAETPFRRLLQILLEKCDSGTLQLPPYELRGAADEIAATIQLLGKRLAALGDRP